MGFSDGSTAWVGMLSEERGCEANSFTVVASYPVEMPANRVPRCSRNDKRMTKDSTLSRWRCSHVAVSACLLILITTAAGVLAQTEPQGDPIVGGLKGRLSSTNVGEKAKLCLQIAERRMAETSKFYAASEDEKAQPALTDVVAYSEL